MISSQIEKNEFKIKNRWIKSFISSTGVNTKPCVRPIKQRSSKKDTNVIDNKISAYKKVKKLKNSVNNRHNLSNITIHYVKKPLKYEPDADFKDVNIFFVKRKEVSISEVKAVLKSFKIVLYKIIAVTKFDIKGHDEIVPRIVDLSNLLNLIRGFLQENFEIENVIFLPLFKQYNDIRELKNSIICNYYKFSNSEINSKI